jgi:alcohol dehydrogenase (cytochrome c)
MTRGSPRTAIVLALLFVFLIWDRPVGAAEPEELRRRLAETLRSGEQQDIRARVEEIITEVNSRSDMENDEKAALLNLAGVALFGIGEYVTASEILEDAMDIRLGLYGEEHPRTLEAMTNLGRAYEELGLWEAAEELLEKVATKSDALVGTSHPWAAQSALRLANLYARTRDYKRAEGYISRAADVLWKYRESYGEDAVSALNTQGYLEQKTGNSAAAIATLGRAAQLASDALGPRSPLRAEVLLNQSMALNDTGRRREALRNAREAESILTENFGPETARTGFAGTIVVGFADAVGTGAVGITSVTDERLANPEPENWLMARGNYQGWMYTPLDQINTNNVKNLTPVWSYSTGVDSGHEAPPIVNDGVMFVAAPYDKLLALDAKTGDLLWEYQRELPEGFGALHNTKRGVALYGDKVYMTGQDAVVIALDAATGEVAWESEPVADWREGYYMIMAPLIVNGKVMVGVSGGEFGVRGFIQAFDAESGGSAWKTYTIPGPGEPGHDTWEGDTWQRGGAEVSVTGTYDRESNVTFWGTGNGSPWFGDQRPGDNLYTSSTVAIDPDTGELKGYFQYHWNDSWGWGEVSAPMVVDYEKDGQTVKGLIKPAHNGYLYWLERTSEGPIGYVNATNYVKQDVFASVDPKTGRPTYHDNHVPGTGKYAEFCPSLWGGKDWPYEAYNPNTGMVYIPANDNHCGSLEGKVQEHVVGEWWTGVDIPDIGFTVDKESKSYGEIQAWNVNTGEKEWTHLYPVMNWGSILTTGGGLVFNGGTNDRMFRAFDARTGEQLWQFETNSGIMAPPISYEVDGVQYIAVASGWGGDPAFQQDLINDILGTNLVVPQGGIIWVFALS